MEVQPKSKDKLGADDSGYFTDFSNAPNDSEENGLPQIESINLSALETDEMFLDAIFNDAAEKACNEGLCINNSNASYLKPDLINFLEEKSEIKQELQRKKSPRDCRDQDKNYDENTLAAIDALFHVLIFHDNCDLFCRKAEETWFWEKSVPELKFMTAKSWFKELVFYFRRFQLYLPVIFALVEGKTEVKLRIPNSIIMEIQFPWELFQRGYTCEDSISDECDFENLSVPTSAEKLKGSQECIYICGSRLRKLEVSVKKLLSKFEALLILSSPVGHQYNKTSFLGRRKSNEDAVKDPFDDPITLI